MKIELGPARSRGDEPTCVYCRDAIGARDAVTLCPGCQVTLHERCQAEVTRCPTPGCEGVPPTASARVRLSVPVSMAPARPEPALEPRAQPERPELTLQEGAWRGALIGPVLGAMWASLGFAHAVPARSLIGAAVVGLIAGAVAGWLFALLIAMLGGVRHPPHPMARGWWFALSTIFPIVGAVGAGFMSSTSDRSLFAGAVVGLVVASLLGLSFVGVSRRRW
jgi:hypothetical protein